MTIKEMICADYAECIQLSKASSELKNALKTNERVPFFLNKLTHEIKKTEASGIKLTRETIKEMTYQLTELFLRQVQAMADKMYATEAEIARQRVQDELKAKFDKDGNADLTEELGVLIKDRQDEKSTVQTD